MGEKRGMKALEVWCKRVTDGYKGVKIDNMTSSWRDGLAFCAMIHHFRPDLIDFESLDKNDIYRNNELAFRTAEHHLGIPALLDAEDMVEYEIPDRLSILTYLSQFYQTFAGTQQDSSPTRAVPKRPASSTERGLLSAISESPPSKVAARVGRREPCAKCGLPVFIAERLLVGGRTLYHRTCFRCARCQHQLSLANCYETEGGQYCCETCPDEVLDTEKSPLTSQNNQTDLDMMGHPGPQDEYSADFELAMEDSSLSESKSCRARLDFVSSQLESDSVSDALTDCSSTASSMNTDKVSVTKDSVAESSVIDVPCSASVKCNIDDSDISVGDNSHKVHTKETPPSSIVKMRLKMFEKGSDDNIKLSKTWSNRKYQDDIVNEDATEKAAEESQVDIILPEDLNTRQDTVLPKISQMFVKTSPDPDSPLQHEIPSEEKPHSPEVSPTTKEKSDTLSSDTASIPATVTATEIIVPIQINDLTNSDVSENNVTINSKPSPVAPRRRSGLSSSEGSPIPAQRNKSTPTPPRRKLTPASLKSSPTIVDKESVTYPEELNPFGDDVEDAGSQQKPVPAARSKTPPHVPRLLEAPKINLNPFWSDGEEPSSEDENSTASKPPVPRPRTLISVTPEPHKTLLQDKFGSVSSLSSLGSSSGGTGSRKKKKPAPAPPTCQDVFNNESLSVGHSPRHRKSRPAPPPPIASHDVVTFSQAKMLVTDPEWEAEKSKKDVTNRNRQTLDTGNETPLSSGPNKSLHGQWKRKKGPAPPRPMPQRRQIKVLPMKEVKQELEDIEVQQQELERQGVTLEKTIRGKFDESPGSKDDSSMTPDVEDLVIQLFELVNEKNELFRRQAELMYLRRQQRLEEEHADLEYQIRCLMERPEHTKTDSDKAREEELIQCLVEVVERRNEIVECLEMDRIREAEEDRSIHSRLNMFSKGKTAIQDENLKSKIHFGKKQKKKSKKDKEKGSSKTTVRNVLDADKDIDEKEEAVPKHIKEKKSKKKWF